MDNTLPVFIPNNMFGTRLVLAGLVSFCAF